MRRAHPPHSGQHLKALGGAFSTKLSTKYREPARRAGLRELRGLSGPVSREYVLLARGPSLTGVRL